MPERDERTEAPTSKRRSEARKEGNVARSTEINSVVVLFVGVLVIRILAPAIYGELRKLFEFACGFIDNPHIDERTIMYIFNMSLLSTAKIVLPIAIGILVMGIAANILQVGWLLTTKPLSPKFSKINPITGFRRLVSMRSVVEAIKNILKLIIIGYVVYFSIRSEMKPMLLLGDAPVGGILLFILQLSFKIILRIVLVMIFLALLDYAYQRYEHEKNLKMTKQEIKDERKQLEGDPQIKMRIRRVQLEMARRRMMREVPRATVVVTNPTFIAIALRYEAPDMDTPVVVAKGKRLVAERIKQIAVEAGVPIVEDKPLARAMYDKVEIGDKIPVEFFTAVAEILAYVYRLKNKMAA